MTTLLIAQATGADLSHVPYQGGPQQVADLIGGQIPLLLDFRAPLNPFLRAGKVKALAVTNDKRLAIDPNLPTFEELGYKGLHIVAWQGVVAPAGTPLDIVGKLNAAIVKALNHPSIRDAFHADGAEISADSPEAFAAFVHAEHARWGRVIRDNKISLG